MHTLCMLNCIHFCEDFVKTPSASPLPEEPLVSQCVMRLPRYHRSSPYKTGDIIECSIEKKQTYMKEIIRNIFKL